MEVAGQSYNCPSFSCNPVVRECWVTENPEREKDKKDKCKDCKSYLECWELKMADSYLYV